MDPTSGAPGVEGGAEEEALPVESQLCCAKRALMWRPSPLLVELLQGFRDSGGGGGGGSGSGGGGEGGDGGGGGGGRTESPSPNVAGVSSSGGPFPVAGGVLTACTRPMLNLLLLLLLLATMSVHPEGTRGNR